MSLNKPCPTDTPPCKGGELHHHPLRELLLKSRRVNNSYDTSLGTRNGSHPFQGGVDPPKVETGWFYLLSNERMVYPKEKSGWLKHIKRKKLFYKSNYRSE